VCENAVLLQGVLELVNSYYNARCVQLRHWSNHVPRMEQGSNTLVILTQY